MAKFYAADLNKKPLSSGLQPMGYNESYDYVTPALAATDEFYFGEIPAGVEINQTSLIHDADADASMALGFETKAGVKTTAAFLAATALATAGRKEGAHRPIVFAEPVYLVGTVSGGGIAAGARFTVIQNGRGIGVA